MLVEALQLVAALAAVALLAGVPALMGWAHLLRHPPGWRDRPPRVRVGWTGVEIGVVVLLGLLVPSLAGAMLNGVGFWPRLFGPGSPTHWEDLPDALKPRAQLWFTVLAGPMTVALALGLFAAASGTRPADLGLRTRGAVSVLVAAWWPWLALSASVFALHIATNAAYQAVVGERPHEHPLMDYVRANAGPADVALVVVQVVVLAPLLEELAFRGILQPWLAVRSWGPDLLMGLAVVLEAVAGLTARPMDLTQLTLAMVLWLLVGVAGRLPERWLRRMLGPAPASERGRPVRSADVARAVATSAALFGLAHGGVWPTPVPLYVLGLGLGVMAQRSRGIVATIAAHALFNAISCVLLLAGG